MCCMFFFIFINFKTFKNNKKKKNIFFRKTLGALIVVKVVNNVTAVKQHQIHNVMQKQDNVLVCLELLESIVSIVITVIGIIVQKDVKVFFFSFINNLKNYFFYINIKFYKHYFFCRM